MFSVSVTNGNNNEVQKYNNQQLDGTIAAEDLNNAATVDEINDNQNINMEETMNYLGAEVGSDALGASTDTEPVEMKDSKKRGKKKWFKWKWIAVLLFLLVVVQPSFADDREKVVGLWKVVSFETEYQGTTERETPLGKNPTGYNLYTPEGRVWSIMTGEGREAPKTDEDRAKLFKSMFALTGIYRVEGDKLITKVDVSWNPAWVGTEQVRTFKIDGDRLQHISDWMPAVTKPERGMGRGILTLERVK